MIQVYVYYDGYQLFQKCVCNLGFIEKSGACVSMNSLNCTDTNSTKVRNVLTTNMLLCVV